MPCLLPTPSQAGSHAAAAEIVCCEVTTRHSSGAARVGAAATEPTAACSPARAAASSSADPMSPAAVRFISDQAVAAGAAPFTAPARLTSTPPPPVSGAELAAGLQAAFPILGAASLATGAGAVKVLVGGRVVHRAGWVAGVSTGLRQREVQHVPSAFVAERHRPLVALARKSVTVRFPPAELRAALSDPSPEWFADMLRPCVREAVVCGEVMRRFRSRHGQAALERWFPEQFGWTVEVVSEKEAGVSGCFRFVTHRCVQPAVAVTRYARMFLVNAGGDCVGLHALTDTHIRYHLYPGCPAWSSDSCFLCASHLACNAARGRPTATWRAT